MMLAPPRHPLSNATPIASANTSPSAKARGPHWTLWGAMGLGVCLVLAVLAGFATSGPADVSSPTSYDIAVQTYGKYMSSAPTLSSADVAGALRKQDFSACARTSDVDASHDSSAVWISVKLVIVKGRVAGATAVVDPGADSKLDIARVGTCVEQVLGNMTQAWQSNEVGKYEVWFVARRGTIDWPGY